MKVRSVAFLAGSRAAALAVAAGLLLCGAGSADAQWFRWPSWDDAIPPMRMERMIEASGYRLTGPVLRNGPVYLANVLGRDDDLERLVIDARDGRLLQRYAAGALARQRVVAEGWADPPRAQRDVADAWSDDERAPPRPPAGMAGDPGNAPLRLASPTPALRLPPPQADQVARADDQSSSPYVILAPPPAAEKPRPKQVRRKKPEPASVALPAEAKPTPVAQPSANPGADAGAPPRVADTKTAPAPESLPAAPAPKASKDTPNDVPVAPLE